MTFSVKKESLLSAFVSVKKKKKKTKEERNWKTGIIYHLSVGFLYFALVINFKARIKKNSGSRN